MPNQPLDLALVRSHLALESRDHDDYLVHLVGVAAEYAESVLGQPVIREATVWTIDAWPESESDVWWTGVREGPVSLLTQQVNVVELPDRNVASVEAIETLYNGVWSVFPPSAYRLTDNRIVLEAGNSWPKPDTDVGGIRITFSSGLGTGWNDIPARVKHGMLKLIAHWFANRGSGFEEVQDIPADVSSLMSASREYRL